MVASATMHPPSLAPAIAPLFRALYLYLGREPVTCFCWPLDAQGLCACGQCTAQKHPNPTRRLSAPPADYSDLPSEVAARYHDGRYGVLAAPSGLIIIDVDCKKGCKGYASLEVLQKELGELPKTLVQITPSGGRHLIFRVPKERALVAKRKVQGGKQPGPAGAYGHGIDVLLGEHDLMLSGAGYKICSMPDDDLPELPLAYFDRLPNRFGGQGGVETGAYNGPGWCDAPEGSAALAWLAERFADDCRNDLPPGSAGARNDPLGLVAMRARAYGLPPELSIPIAWENWNPRCAPPLDDPSDPAFAVRFAHLWESGRCELGGAYLHRLHVWIDEIRKANRIPLPLVDAASLGPIPPERRRSDPWHEYTFARGGYRTTPKFEKSSFHELSWILSTGEWEGVFQHDDLARKIYAVNPPFELSLERGKYSNNDCRQIQLWLNEALQKDATLEVIKDSIVSAAQTRRYNPLTEYLNSLPVGELDEDLALARLDDFAEHVMGIVSYEERQALIRQLVGSVARAYVPGCKMQTCVVLVGEEGVGKSSIISALYGKQYFTDSIGGNLGSKDAFQYLWGRWAIELAELASFKASSRELALGYISKDADIFRAPYAEEVEDHPRSCVFWATTNDATFLAGEAGDRRYEPVTVGRDVDWHFVGEHKDSVWTCAARLFKSGFPYWVEGRKKHAVSMLRKSDYVQEDAFGVQVHDRALQIVDSGDRATIPAVWRALCGGDAASDSKLVKATSNRIGKALRSFGWVRHRGDGTNSFFVPPGYPTGPLSHDPRCSKEREHAGPCRG